GTKYNVTVQQQPHDPTQACTVKNGSGVVKGNVTNIAVECSVSFVARFAYTANANGTVTIFAVDEATGQLYARGYADTLSLADTITVDPNDRFAYVTQGNADKVVVLAINPTSGALTPIQTVPSGGRRPFPSVIDPSGRFLYVGNGTANTLSAFAINASSGMLT